VVPSVRISDVWHNEKAPNLLLRGMGLRKLSGRGDARSVRSLLGCDLRSLPQTSPRGVCEDRQICFVARRIIKMRGPIGICCLFLLVGGLAEAQNSAPIDCDVAGPLRKQWEITRDLVVPLAKAIPEDKYD